MKKKILKNIKKKLLLISLLLTAVIIYFLGYWQGSLHISSPDAISITPSAIATKSSNTTLLNGSITAIGADNKVSIKDTQGKDYVILVKDINIIDNKSKPFAFNDLKIGRRVIVYVKSANGEYTAVRMIVT